MDARLQARLGVFASQFRRARLFRALALCWALVAAAGLVLLVLHFCDYVALLAVALVAGGITFVWQKMQPDDLGELIRGIEPEQREVRDLLAAAVEQKPDLGAYNFLQWRVIEEALAHPRGKDWQRETRRRVARAQAAHAIAWVAMAGVLLVMARHGTASGASVFASLIGPEITVTPGDTNVERGTGLVIAARFGGAPPAEATLILTSATGKETRLPMARRLADPIFGANIPEISEAAVYRVEYSGKKTRDYKVGIFEYPALARADAELRYPAYTGLTNRTILDTLRVSAVEGTHLTYTLQLNKPVARARWIGRGGALTLSASSNAVATLSDFLLTNSARFSLELVDADGRSNKFPTDFVLQALTNQRPVVRMVFPHGDARVSRLEELRLQGEASDDFGLLKYGIGFGVAGQEPRFVELGQAAPANTKRPFDYLIALEKLGVEVDQSVTCFAWADDYGPDGQIRRTFSDMFFADVRPFDEIFRADQSGSDGNENGGQEGGGNERTRLAELQKQIVVATWNLQRDKPGAAGARNP